MRSLRWLLLAAILVLTAGLYGIYRNQRTTSRRQQRAIPPSLPVGTIGNAIDYEWAQSADGKPAVKIHAKNSTVKDNNRTELEEIELRIYMKDAKHYDRVRSPKAEFSTGDSKLYAPGEAEITLGVPTEGESPKTLTTIKAAGINFDSQSGEAVTTQPVAFTFDGGDGICVGAAYNPQNHQLHLQGGVSLNLRGKTPGATPMKVEAGELTYSEVEGLVQLGPWSKMTRGGTVMTGAASTIHLKEKKLDWVETTQINGEDKRPGRELVYNAPSAQIHYNTDREIEKINGAGGAKLTTKGNGSSTTMAGQTVDLFFNTQTGDSELASAIAKGTAKIESVPNPDPKGRTGDTKILQSEILNLFMKPGGKDLDRVNTTSPAVVEFVPAIGTRHRRILRSSDMDIRYGAKNSVQSFHANTAVTETYPTADENAANLKAKKPPIAVSRTSSRVLDATFNEDSEVRAMKQSGDFRYEQGSRKAQATTGSLDNEKDLMLLDGNARFADESGSTAADTIEIKQESGDFDAKGHVQTTRLPEAKKTGTVTAGSDMLDKDEPTQGLADHVLSANRNKVIHYIGHAVLWQASNRIQADRIDIDRTTTSLIAQDNVISQFQDKPKPASPVVKGKPAPPPAQPLATIVRAQRLVYTDKDRQAIYSGGVAFRRANMAVDSTTLTAFLNDDKSDADSRIHHAIADGKVNIVKVMPARRRIGRSEHAEYYTEEGRITLTGGEPVLEDTVRGNTKGDKITYYTEDDRLTIEGAPAKPVRSLLHKKKS